MCGIFGFTKYAATPDQVVVAAKLAEEMVSRGRSSWGTTDGLTVARFVGAITSDPWDESHLLYFSEGPFGVMLAHTRAASHGSVSKENAHPHFMCSEDATNSLIGVHNGTLTDKSMAMYNPNNFEVDTQMLYDRIINKKPLDVLEGTGMLVWIENEKVLKFCRFNSTNIFIAPITEAPNGVVGGLVWASTKTAVETATKRSGIKLGDEIKLDEFCVYEVAEDPLTQNHILVKTAEKFNVGVAKAETYTDAYGATKFRQHSHGGSCGFGGVANRYNHTVATLCPSCKYFKVQPDEGLPICGVCAITQASKDHSMLQYGGIFLAHHNEIGRGFQEKLKKYPPVAMPASLRPKIIATVATKTSVAFDDSDESEGDICVRRGRIATVGGKYKSSTPHLRMPMEYFIKYAHAEIRNSKFTLFETLRGSLAICDGSTGTTWRLSIMGNVVWHSGPGDHNSVPPKDVTEAFDVVMQLLQKFEVL